MSNGITDQPPGATPIEDTGGLLPDITTRAELNDAEGLNIVNANEWLDNGRIEGVFTVRFYRELHTKMFDQVWTWAGALRTHTGDQVGKPFVRAEQVAAELGKVAMMFNREWEAMKDHRLAVPFLARYHHALVLVHPFNNGNGRWSRLATDAVLQRVAGQPPLTWATEAATLDADSDERDSYIIALRAADTGNFQPLTDHLVALNPDRG